MGYQLTEVMVGEPQKQNFIDRFVMELDVNDLVIIVGGLGEHQGDFVKKVILRGLQSELQVNSDAVAYLEEHFPAALHKFGEKLTAFPEGSVLFTPKFSNTFGYGLNLGDKCIISLPNNIPDSMHMLMLDAANFAKDYSGYQWQIAYMEFDRTQEDALDVKAFELSTPENVVLTGKAHDKYLVSIIGDNNFFASEVLDDLEKISKIKKHTELPKEKKKSPIALIIILLMLIVAFAVGAFFLTGGSVNLSDFMGNSSSDAEILVSTPIDDIVPTSDSNEDSADASGQAASSDEPNSTDAYTPPQNSDIVAEIRIEGTNIDTEVVMGSDNQFYKEHNIDKEPDDYGAVFADYRSDFDATAGNIVIYGANPSDDSLFADLEKYRNVDFYKEHPTIEFFTAEGEYIYKIAGAMMVNLNPDQGAVYDIEMGITDSTVSELSEFGEMLRECSFIHTDVDITGDDHVLTLYTDSYEFMGASTVVIARRVRPEESSDVNTDIARMNENPLLPDVWYETYGGTKPGEEVEQSIESSSASQAPASAPPAQSSTASTPPLPESSSVAAQTPESSSQASENSEDGVTELRISPNTITMTAGEAMDLELIVTPEDASSSFQWYVNDEDVAAVWYGDNYIELEAISEGRATVTVTADNGVKTSMQVVVNAEEDSTTSSDDNMQTTPPADVANEILSVKVSGRTVSDDAYTIISQIVENETRGNLHPEALKAHVVATYSYVKFNNLRGTSPSVLTRTTISSNVKAAVDAVLGEAVYYNGSIINAAYYSTGNGYSTTSQSVWGTHYPYLISVESPYDSISPYYEGVYRISEEDFAEKVDYTYNIDLYEHGDPEDWVEILSYNPGNYVNEVSLGGIEKSQGGEVALGATITGRNIREQLLDFSIRSTSFDVSYDDGRFTITSYGYGHGVGMSQWGAHGMAEDGYDYEEILTHYYSGTEVK